MSVHSQRLMALRQELQRRRLDGFVVPLTDEHMSEFVGAYAQRLAWLTGFQGTAGTAVVLSEKAAMFVDGRYTLQVREQVDPQDWSFESTAQTSIAAWLAEHAPTGARIGYDPWLHPKAWVSSTRASLAKKAIELVAAETNAMDAVWSDRPARSAEHIVPHPEHIAGKSSDEKRRAIAGWLKNEGIDAAVLSALDSIAWTFNIRGRDIPRTPVPLAYALVNDDGSAELFVAPQNLPAARRLRASAWHVGDSVRLHPYDDFAGHLRSLANRSIAVDPDRAVVAIFEALATAGAKVIEARDPAVLPKAIKNAAEIAGHKAAQARDGAALTRFLHWLSVEATSGALDEIGAAARLDQFRADTGCLQDLSFSTISAAGPNAALVHYMPTPASNRPLALGSLYLVDSGAQYLDGTTDVTRTVAIGTPTAEMRDRFTRVLKGHIALARIVFPVGTRGGQLDVLARQHLWAMGLDYAHGTGHGVGAYLGVHEGPQHISYTAHSNEPLVAGMILSNEPGYYKAGEYGIRIENLVLVVEREIAGAERPMLGFESLTFAPIDRSLIEVALLSPEERGWIDDYHADVAQFIGPQLSGAAGAWLMDVTRPLDVAT
jgi:Xaa-Pro aminopeptidase